MDSNDAVDKTIEVQLYNLCLDHGSTFHKYRISAMEEIFVRLKGYEDPNFDSVRLDKGANSPADISQEQ